jgi:ketosteroid isomerase-like protein
MTRSEALAFARAWIDAWNRRDVAAVLAHFADDAVFTSPKAAVFVGDPVVRGKSALAAYWQRASAGVAELRFTLDRVVWDPEARELLVLYDARIDGTTRRACELMRFDADGRQVAGEALYGAELPGAHAAVSG